jgi:MFS superfamily sulfate permease-like transporter
VRFGAEAALTIKYGPRIVNVVGDLFQHHLTITLVALALLLGMLLLWVLRKRYRKSCDGNAGLDDADPTAEPRRRKRSWQ